MDHNIRRIAIIMFFLIAIFCFASCGNTEDRGIIYQNQGSNMNQTVNKKISYKSKHNILKYYEDIDHAYVKDGKIYYITHNKEKSVFQTVHIIDPNTGSLSKLEALTKYHEECKAKQGENYDLHKLAIAPDGTYLLLASWQYEQMDYNSRKMWLLKLNMSGNVESEIPLSIDALQNWEETYLFYDNEGFCYLLDASGITIFDQKLKEIGKIVERVESLTRTADGKVVAINEAIDEDFWIVYRIDRVNCKLTGIKHLYKANDDSFFEGVFYPGYEEYDLLYSSDLSLYGYKLGNDGHPGKGEQLLTWLNCDVEGTTILALGATEKGFVCATLSDAFGAETVVLKERENTTEDTQILTLACRDLPETVAQMVQRYNRQDNGFRVEIIDYGAIAAAAGLDVSVDKLTTDLISGNIPDMFCTDQIDVQSLIESNLLEDLWPYIDADGDLGGREALVQPVFNAMEQDGKLYTIADGFQVYTVFALSDIVGEEEGWSVDDLQKILAQQESYLRIGNGTQQSVLESVISLCSSQFVDRKNWTASFDSPEFVQLIEFAGHYPSQQDSSADDTYWLAEGQQLLREGQFIDLFSLVRSKWGYFGTNQVTCIGFPGAAGNGSAFVIKTPLAMSSNCKNKAAAWSFLRMLLLPETQQFPELWDRRNQVYAMPTNMEEYQAMINEALTGKTVPIYFPSLGGNMMELPEWTQEDADWFWEYLSDITIVRDCDEEIANIIRDEVMRYFDGKQSSKVSAENIQSRVKIYLAEKSKQ